MSAPSVLVVEDSGAYARLIELLLEDALGEVDVRLAGTLASALEQLADQPSDCLLLDLSLPDEHGTGGLTRLRAAHPGLRVVVLSGHDEPGLEAELTGLGAVAFVRKGDEAGALGPALALALAG